MSDRVMLKEDDQGRDGDPYEFCVDEGDGVLSGSTSVVERRDSDRKRTAL